MLFSIVMACYNGEKTIARAIESIISQSDYGYELILVDDCSTDSTPDILEGYRVIDGRIKVLRTVRNSGGPATPKNLGISCAVGDVIMFCDQDDQYLPGRIKEFGDVFSTRADVDVLFCDYFLNKNGLQTAYLKDVRNFPSRAKTYLVECEGGLYATKRFLGCMASGIDTGMATISVAIRRCVFARLDYCFSIDYRIVDDIDLWYRLASFARVFYIDKPLAVYFVHGSNLSRNKELNAKESIRFHRINFARFREYLTKGELLDARALVSRMAYRNASVFSRDRDLCEAFCEESLWYQFSWRAFKSYVRCRVSRIPGFGFLIK